MKKLARRAFALGPMKAVNSALSWIVILTALLLPPRELFVKKADLTKRPAWHATIRIHLPNFESFALTSP